MKKLLVLLFTIVCCVYGYSSQNRKVLLIGIDGTRSDALQQANTPNIDNLLAGSLYSFDSWHTGITWSGPSWSTILTGVNWNKHGVTDNGFAVKKFSQYAPLPTLAKQIKPNLQCSIIAEWPPLIDSINNAAWDHKVHIPDTETWITADSAVAELQNPDIDLLFTYFDKVDMTGHFTTFSPSNPLYINAIQSVDSAVGKVLSALYARPNYSAENWLILLVTDHGGTGFMHGGNSNEERHIWWIANGSVVPHMQISFNDPGTYNCNNNSIFDSTCVNESLLKQSPVQTDITVTALHHLIFDSGINPETKPEWNLDGKSWLLNPNAVTEISEEEDISIYPNPNQGIFVVKGLSKNLESKLPVEVFSTDGRKVFSEMPQSAEMSISLGSKTSGMYYIKVGSVIKKVIIN